MLRNVHERPQGIPHQLGIVASRESCITFESIISVIGSTVTDRAKVYDAKVETPEERLQEFWNAFSSLTTQLTSIEPIYFFIKHMKHTLTW